MALFQQAGKRGNDNAGSLLVSLGRMAQDGANYDQAQNDFERALTFLGDDGDPVGRLSAYFWQGVNDSKQHKDEEAITMFTRSLAIAEQAGERTGQANALSYRSN